MKKTLNVDDTLMKEPKLFCRAITHGEAASLGFAARYAAGLPSAFGLSYVRLVGAACQVPTSEPGKL